MKRYTSLFISLFVLFSFCIPLQAQAQQNEDINVKNVSGVSISIDNFNKLYGSQTSSDDALLKLEKNAEVTLGDFLVQGNEISFNATVAYNGQNKNLVATGTLFDSYKKQESINSIVGDITDKDGNFTILKFEIYNDKSYDKTIIDSELRNAPHLKLYLTDNSGNILLFEVALPVELNNIQILNDDKIDTLKDFFWFANVIKPSEQKQIPTTEALKEKLGVVNPGISPKAVGSFSDWAGDTTYYTTLYVGMDYVQVWSLPYGTWKSTNVNGSDIWTNSFKIAEHLAINGTTSTIIDNPFKYRNVKLVTAVGGKSIIINAMVDGKLQGKSNGSTLASKIIEKTWSNLLPTLPTPGKIKEWVDAIIDAGTSKTITLGSTNIKLNNDKTIVEGLNQQSSADMFKSTDSPTKQNVGHYLTLQTTVQYEGTPTTVATKTNGLMKIKWEVYYPASTKFGAGYKELPFTYTIKG
ncbi:hypothetical protein ACFSTH_02400 [Paenibacillus yanchengensis]|uniref:Uncharacterized protein n=1 Tax=Paenibacillus yanchengensis TaxID=2035833 RepID=A0ABW4YGP1_9BACL